MSLLQLQQSDVKVRELETAATQLPAKLDPLRRDLAKLQGMLDAERAKLGETETWRKQQQDLLDREREALKAAQNKLNASKNTKEYGAANREVENKRKSISDREAELKKISEAASTSTGQLAARDKDVDGVRDELAQSEAGIADQMASITSQLEEARKTRDEARSKVEKQWLKTYDTLTSKRGYAVAPVIKGVCQGCHMALPPQLNNILARMESIETCPRCARLVYRKELLEKIVEPAAAAAPEEPKS
jgi:predicted  nucleic acid-binding Zn-ribbon protein